MIHPIDITFVWLLPMGAPSGCSLLVDPANPSHPIIAIQSMIPSDQWFMLLAYSVGSSVSNQWLIQSDCFDALRSVGSSNRSVHWSIRRCIYCFQTGMFQFILAPYLLAGDSLPMDVWYPTVGLVQLIYLLISSINPTFNLIQSIRLFLMVPLDQVNPILLVSVDPNHLIYIWSDPSHPSDTIQFVILFNRWIHAGGGI